MKWSIRSLLNPVITRCLIYGVSPFDLEFILRKVEEKPIINSKMLQDTWISQWERKAEHFKRLGEEESKKKNSISVSEYYMLAAKCYYACYLMNSDEIENKKNVYENLEYCYRKSIFNMDNPVEDVLIPFTEYLYLSAYLHIPKEDKYKKPYSCVIIFTGMGSSKEEVEIQARPLIERGIAVLAIDMPGTGSSLFKDGVKLNGDNIEHAIDELMKFISNHPFIDENKIGTYGLCMGGGYAYRAAAKYPQIKACVNLFPLFITMLEENAIPRWMKSGKWAEFQLDDESSKERMKNMEVLTEGNVKSSYLIVHSKYDNWMDIEKTKEIYNKTSGYKEEIIIEEPPVYADEESVMHAMPVGEQMNWIKIKAADFMMESLK